MLMRSWITIVCLVVALSAAAQDSLNAVQPEGRKLSWLRRTIRGFSYIDTSYVEPQHYNWSVMAQGTYTYDYYRLSANEQSILFAPAPTFKFGPYFGWRWIFLGYTVALNKADVSKLKLELDASIYAAQVGVDVYYRRTVSDYRIREVKLGRNVIGDRLEDVPFDGLKVGITGFNAYYIFNHQRFSYPAAFAQSTMQKISCGSWMAGLGYMRNLLEFDHEKLEQVVHEHAGQTVNLDSGLMFNSVKYYNVSLSAGYAYNWVFARNCLFCASLMASLAYKTARGETVDDDRSGFDLHNINLDGVGRFAVVYNNNRWYAGASAIVRAYRYHKPQFEANNIFGNFNFYVGFNFGARGGYKKR